MDLDVQIFEKEIFKHFPSVKPSAWMTYLGPTFLFYDEYMTDQTQGLQGMYLYWLLTSLM